ncbi:hypothetical protein [Rubripirellula reticaptiva]|uniref:Uncharacterized protein n=1 Tax=Rubripirellula reticaptiva TaxID=2528013 RepID=A0A5C6F9E4_9BACT|nr:hypothetical protein [Rubripirellula reticaptiva]TWU56121.1 hypothetical protein Poly59_24250 [Rubripirellula reticaptiva]
MIGSAKANFTSMALAMVLLTNVSRAVGRDAFDLLSGFDRDRIAAAYPPSTEKSSGELAKLLFRLKSVDTNSLAERMVAGQKNDVGNVLKIDGKIISTQKINVPPRLVEFLEFKRMTLLQVQVDDAEVIVITANVSADAKIGDRVRGVGVIANAQTNSPAAVAVAKLGWIPRAANSVGWRLLAHEGVDIGMVADVSTRNRKPLVGADSDAFYAVLAAAKTVTQQSNLPPAVPASAVKMLTDATSMAGEWIRLELETVQITRISVIDPLRRSQLSADHYFQIDAVADLGRAVIKIESSEKDSNETGEIAPSATFENRYPVSIVTTELPAFLNEAVWKQAGPDAVIAEVSRQVAIDGFFFRLWSYQSEYMERFGGEDQFGPLVIAARIIDQTPKTADPIGVSIIGKVAAVAVLAGLLATWIWHRLTTAGDQVVSRKRKQQQSIDDELLK